MTPPLHNHQIHTPPATRARTQRDLSPAAGALFANSVIRGMNGEKGVVTPTFVKSPLYEDQGIEYFSSNVELGVSRRRLFFFPLTYHHLRFDDGGGVEDVKNWRRLADLASV